MKIGKNAYSKTKNHIYENKCFAFKYKLKKGKDIVNYIILFVNIGV